MATTLKFQFDADQAYQLEAIQAVVGLFEGMPSNRYNSSLNRLDEIVPNLPPDKELDEDALLINLQAIQERNALPLQSVLEVNEGLVIEGAGNESHRFPSFTVEMETATGKTYVYLRTLYELNKAFGFLKFAIIVPSVAIFEGVRKSFEIMQPHFKSLYHNAVFNLIPYDGANLGVLRAFASDTTGMVLLLTIDAFNKASNTLYKSSEKLPGELLPFQFIQQTRPILILDEPQSIDNTETARKAIRTLHPLFALRYSATHRVHPNQVFRLTPVDAYRQSLVKKIEVIGLRELSLTNEDFLVLETVSDDLRATIRTNLYDKGVTKEGTVILKKNDDLFAKTRNEDHQQGFKVAEINRQNTAAPFVAFENGVVLSLTSSLVPNRQRLFQAQIEETVKQHLRRQAELADAGLKVLSLFFIDRVANYVNDDGIIKALFDQAFDKHKGEFPVFRTRAAAEVRQGYFAQRKEKTGREIAIDTAAKNKEEREMEKQAFKLIMRDKERLLSFAEPVCFIFAHSALREGWDNPNVFQICTLNQTHSVMKKRQEIGRGLRLCVNQEGARVLEQDVNILTVVANESYESYVGGLQQEYVETGDAAPPAPKKPQAAIVERRDDLFNLDEFRAFWRKLSQRTRYTIKIDTGELIKDCANRFNRITFPEPAIERTKGFFVITEFKVELERVEKGGKRAFVRVTIRDTSGHTTTNSGLFPDQGFAVAIGDDLARKLRDPRLKGMLVVAIKEGGDDSLIRFDSGIEVTRYTPFETSTEKELKKIDIPPVLIKMDTSYPVFDLISRTARETMLTRPTVNAIFASLKEDQQRVIFKNPEGFAGVFINTIRDETARHVAERLLFIIEPEQPTLDEAVEAMGVYFPKTDKFAQRELIESGPRGIYDKVQIDSDVERSFVKHRLCADEENILCYFKFPPKFKIPFPKIINNYNPDWGILRQGAEGKPVLELVRETKGTTDLDRLQFSSEQRKIRCAQQFFKTLGISYRVVDANVQSWWLDDDSYIQKSIGG